MIQIETLDKNKTYVGYQIGKALISKLIQKLSKKATKLPVNQIASHVFALVYIKNEWYVFEAHAQWKGCKKLKYKDWLKDYKPNGIFCAERPLYIDALEFYANPHFNPGYSFAQITGLALEEISEINFWNDNPGMVCSEYLAIADIGFKIAYKYKLKCNRIKPVHWQMEIIEICKSKEIE